MSKKHAPHLIDINDPNLYRKGYSPQDWNGHDSYPHMIEWDDLEAVPAVDAVPVVRCKECQHRYSTYDCPMRRIVAPAEGQMYYEDFTTDEGFCDRGERRTNDSAL